MILSEKEFNKNRELLEDSKYSIAQLIDFVESELNYKRHREESKDEYKFFDRWLSLVEFQINKEEFDYDFVHYKRAISELEAKEITFLVDKSGENLAKLREIDNKIKEVLSKTTNPSDTVRITLEIKASEGEPFRLMNIGSLKDDIDLINNTITVEIDDYLPESFILNPENRLYIGIYRPAHHLHRQKRALIRFQDGELVNPELKRMLISPSLIRKTTDPL